LPAPSLVLFCTFTTLQHSHSCHRLLAVFEFSFKTDIAIEHSLHYLLRVQILEFCTLQQGNLS